MFGRHYSRRRERQHDLFRRDIHHSGKGHVVIDAEHFLIPECDKPRLVRPEISVGSRLFLKGPLRMKSVCARAALWHASHVVLIERGNLLFHRGLPLRAARATHGLAIGA